MRHFLLITVVLIALSSCANKSCEDFQTGNFRYTDEAYKDVKISRTVTGEREVEIDGKTIIKPVGTQSETMMREGREVTDIYDITWDGPCSYSIVFKSTNSQIDQFHTQYDTIRMKIIGIDGNKYQFEANLYDKNPVGELELID